MRERRRRVGLVTGAVLAAALLAGCLAVVQPPPPPGTYTGLGFDTCAAPSVGQMQAWTASPYHSIGVYIGGADRACAQANLTASWVSSVAAQGWRLAPLYVGLQAPCSGIGATIDPNNAVSEGYNAALDAISHAQILGLGSGTPIYFDMEAYNNADATCSGAVTSFINAWDGMLQSQGYVAGFYSSAASGIADQVWIAEHPSDFPGYSSPDDIWFAHWNNSPTVFGDPYIPDTLWNFHQRIHQYVGGHDESYNGVVLNIDGDADDARLAA
jgi:hypothetical protein